MATQLTYPSNYAPAVAGMLANMEVHNTISRNVQDATLAFGIPVFQGALDDTVTATPGTVFRGITLIDRGVRPFSPDLYAQYDTAAVLTKGVVWVIATHAVAVGEPVFITAGGLFTDVASGDTALPGAMFDSTAAAGGLVKVRLG